MTERPQHLDPFVLEAWHELEMWKAYDQCGEGEADDG